MKYDYQYFQLYKHIQRFYNYNYSDNINLYFHVTLSLITKGSIITHNK